jgi:hypothetical protein
MKRNDLWSGMISLTLSLRCFLAAIYCQIYPMSGLRRLGTSSRNNICYIQKDCLDA